MDSISSFCVCILTYAIIYVLIHHIIFQLYICFLKLFFIFSSTPVLTFSIDVVFLLSILWRDWLVECPADDDMIANAMRAEGLAPQGVW